MTNRETIALYAAGGCILLLTGVMLWYSLRLDDAAVTQRNIAAPTPTSEAQASRTRYAEEAAAALAGYERDFAALSVLYAAYELDPSVAGDPVWAGELDAVVHRIAETGARIRGLSAPAGMLPLHNKLLQVDQHVTAAALATPSRTSVRNIDQAAEHMAELVDLLRSRDWSDVSGLRPAGAPTAEDRPRSIGVRVTVTPTAPAVFPPPTP